MADFDRFLRGVSENLYFDSKLQTEMAKDSLSPPSDLDLTQNGEHEMEICAMIIEWIFKAGEELALNVDTVYLAINYFSRVLSAQKIKTVLVLELAQGCLFLAAKFNEPDPPSARSLLHCSGSDPSFVPKLIKFEALILEKLDWKLDVVTVSHYLLYFIKHLKVTDETKADLLSMSNYFSRRVIARCNFSPFKTFEIALGLLSYSKQILFCEEFDNLDMDELDLGNRSPRLDNITSARVKNCREWLWHYFSDDTPSEALRIKRRRTEAHLALSPKDIKQYIYKN